MKPVPRWTWPPDGVDLDSVGAFERDVASLREQAFALSDAARTVLGHGFPDVHVHLQAAANELGELERLFEQPRP